MHAIFAANGRAFSGLSSSVFLGDGSKIDKSAEPNDRPLPFENVQAYNLICDSLGIEPLPNNGTFRLSLSARHPALWPHSGFILALGTNRLKPFVQEEPNYY